MQNNPICFWELASHNAEKSVKFFEKVFGWTFDYNEDIGIYEIPAGESSVKFWGGGIFTLKKAKLPFLTIYILVEDIEQMITRVEDEGGHIVEPIIDLPTGSKISLFNEPSGVTFAMLQPAKKQ